MRWTIGGPPHTVKGHHLLNYCGVSISLGRAINWNLRLLVSKKAQLKKALAFSFLILPTFIVNLAPLHALTEWEVSIPAVLDFKSGWKVSKNEPATNYEVIQYNRFLRRRLYCITSLFLSHPFRSVRGCTGITQIFNCDFPPEISGFKVSWVRKSSFSKVVSPSVCASIQRNSN